MSVSFLFGIYFIYFESQEEKESDYLHIEKKAIVNL